MKTAIMRALFAIALTVTFIFTPSTYSIIAAGAYTQYIPATIGYAQIAQGGTTCWNVPQDSRHYDIYLYPNGGDVDLKVMFGNSIVWSDYPYPYNEYVALTPAVSYANGIRACAYGYQAGSYRIVIKHSGW